MKYVLFFFLFSCTHAIAQEEIVPIETSGNKEFSSEELEEDASFPGGMHAMYSWIASNVIYPAFALEKNIEGKVYVSFVIETDGSPSNIKIVRGVHPTLDVEAIRLVKTMPNWNPGKNNGKPVRVRVNLPINFKLN